MERPEDHGFKLSRDHGSWFEYRHDAGYTIAADQYPDTDEWLVKLLDDSDGEMASSIVHGRSEAEREAGQLASRAPTGIWSGANETDREMATDPEFDIF